jgi:hypothetical protein
MRAVYIIVLLFGLVGFMPSMMATDTPADGIFVVDHVGKLFQIIEWDGALHVVRVTTPVEQLDGKSLVNHLERDFTSPWGTARVFDRKIEVSPPGRFKFRAIPDSNLLEGEVFEGAWVDRHGVSYHFARFGLNLKLRSVSLPNGALINIGALPSQTEIRLSGYGLTDTGEGVMLLGKDGKLSTFFASFSEDSTQFGGALEQYFGMPVLHLTSGHIASYENATGHTPQVGPRKVFVVAGNYEHIAEVDHSGAPFQLRGFSVSKELVMGPALRFISTEEPAAVDKIKGLVQINGNPSSRDAFLSFSKLCRPSEQ